MNKRTVAYIGTILIGVALLSGFSCSKGTQNLATASDAIAHSLANAQLAARQAVQQGIIGQDEDADFEKYLVQVSQAGLILDQGIRANESAASLSAKVNSFLQAFNALNTSGVAQIKNPNLKLTLSTIITGAETSIAIITATLGK